MNIPFKKEQEKVTRISKGFSQYRITIRKCHYSQRGFHTVECGSNSGEGRVSNFIFLVEAGGGETTVLELHKPKNNGLKCTTHISTESRVLFRKTSKLSRNIFWACWDHVVAQKSIFQKKSPKMQQTQGNTPPRLATCVIFHLRERYKKRIT